MKRRYLTVITAAVFILAQQCLPASATQLLNIGNISPTKLQVRGGESLKITWNFSAENFSMPVLQGLTTILKPVSGIDCRPRCPQGLGKIISGNTSGGLWETYIDIPKDVMQTDYEITVTLPGYESLMKVAKADMTIKISDEANPADTVVVTPTITGTGWAPAIGPVTRTSDGLTFKVKNFNINYTWSYSATRGSTSLDGDGNFVLKGLKPGEPTQVSIQSTSSTNVVTTATFTERSILGAPYVPAIELRDAQRYGFTFRVLGFDTAYRIRLDSTLGTVVTRNGGSGYMEYQVVDLPESSTASVGIFTNRVYYGEEYAEGYEAVVGSSLPLPPIPAPVITPTPSPTPTVTASPTPTPTPSASPTPTPTPTTSKKTATTISCIKGKVVKKVKAFNPKCPNGYKVITTR